MSKVKSEKLKSSAMKIIGYLLAYIDYFLYLCSQLHN